jgi:hypothetical protein
MSYDAGADSTMAAHNFFSGFRLGNLDQQNLQKKSFVIFNSPNLQIISISDTILINFFFLCME